MNRSIRSFIEQIGLSPQLAAPLLQMSGDVPRYIPEIHAGHTIDFGETGRRLGRQIVAMAGTVFASLGAGQLALIVLEGALAGFALSAAAALVALIIFLYLLGHWVLPVVGLTSQTIGDLLRQFMSGVERAE